MTGVDAIVATSSSSYALVDGEVWAWGDNWAGQLGNGTRTDSSTPVSVNGIPGVDAIACGSHHCLAVSDDGVWAWGFNAYGQLGASTTSDYQSIPIRATTVTLSGIDAIAAQDSTSFALVDGEVLGWGYGCYGILGNNEACGSSSTPVKASGLTGVSAIAAGSRHMLALGTASPTNGTVTGSANAAAGATVTTDVDGDGATSDDPLEVAVRTPNAGPISIVVSSAYSTQLISGFGFYGSGKVIEIEAPDATVQDPLVLTFTLDSSVSYVGTLYRDGVAVSTCTGPTAADPDPCIASLTRLANGDYEVVVLSSHASEWGFVVEGLDVGAGGPYSVAEGSTVTLNGSASGGTAPYAFLWDAVPGLNDPSITFPTFRGLDDGVTPLRLRVIDSLGIPGEDESQVAVTNALPTVNSLSLPASAAVNEQVSLQAAFSDAGVADTHSATVNWGDGTTQQMTVTEQNGAGTASKTHAYTASGVKTVTVTVTDDDGGQRQRQQTIEVLYGCVGPTPAGAIVRGAGNDTINGTEGDDVIVDAGGSNTINGRGGNDVICSGSGNDVIDAGAGNDLVVDKGGSNTVAGGGGNDQVTAGTGNDTIHGGAGDDTISAGNGNNALNTGDGNDRITTGSGNDKVDSGTGNDTIQAGDGNNTVTAGSGDDTITAGSGSDSVDGGIGFDRCSAGGGKNTIKNCEA
jgi:Ca2+-binding RTX toxin-like protein